MEFRYLRTVIVTAAVYRGFDQELAPHHLTFRHRAGVTPYTSTFVLAECCVFNKQSQPPILCDPVGLVWRADSPTWGTPSPEVTVSICRVPSPGFSQAPWCFDTSPPVSVCGTVIVQLKLRGFSWKRGLGGLGGPWAALVITSHL